MLRRTKDYFLNSSIHGLHYIVDPDGHWTERTFWAVVCIAALYCTLEVLLGNLYNFKHYAVSFGMDTSYLEFNTTFPSFSICEVESNERITAQGEKIFGKVHNLNLDSFLRDIAFYYGVCYTCNNHCGKSIKCNENFDEVTNMVRAPCKQLISHCSFNGEPFECCEHFLPLKTEMGPCYTINSELIKKELKLKMTVNRVTGPGKLEFMAYEKIKIFLHSPEDVPFFNHPQPENEVLRLGQRMNLYFQVKEIDNDPSLRYVSIQQRNCRFPDESDLEVYKLYSYSGCVVECRARAQIEFCNCTQHFIPKIKGVPTCNMNGMICLNNLTVVETLRALRTSDYTEKQGLVCDCVPSCNEPEYTILYTDDEPYVNHNSNGTLVSKVALIMASLPHERFKRKVVRTQLDLVVSMGGTIGLFLGASLLSIFELIYYFCLRKSISPKKEATDGFSLNLSQDDDFKKILNLKNPQHKISHINMVMPYLP